jgi:hypothetical protein
MTTSELYDDLLDMDPTTRERALDELLAAVDREEIKLGPERPVVNMHCHTFYSYNGYGHSPTSLAWLAKQHGWHALGVADFDVLDALDETYRVADRLGIRASAGLETRVYVPEFADREINSPGEPGVFYFVAMGFPSAEAPGSAAEVLAGMRKGAAARNRDMAERINAYLDPVRVDYDADVLPLTPSGNATERHMLVAYDMAARRVFEDRQSLVAFWARKLGVSEGQMGNSLGDTPGVNDLIRAKLMKQGGVGYVAPGPDTFPPLGKVAEAVRASGALPLAAWLDGSSEGEQALDELLELMLSHGVAGLVVIPERNWHYGDPNVRREKVRELDRLITMARRMNLPIVAGTEMNKAGQPILDDFAAAPLTPYVQDMISGADWCCGHTLMARVRGLGYQSAWARENLPERQQRNAFYAEVGRLLVPGSKTERLLDELDDAWEPGRMLETMGAR